MSQEQHGNVRVSVTLSTQTLERLESLERQFGWSKSQVISVAIAHYQPPIMNTERNNAHVN